MLLLDFSNLACIKAILLLIVGADFGGFWKKSDWRRSLIKVLVGVFFLPAHTFQKKMDIATGSSYYQIYDCCL